MAPRGGAGFGKASPFALLEHADEQGHVENLDLNDENDADEEGWSKPVAKASAKPKPNAPANRPAPSNQQAPRQKAAVSGSSRAEDYYRAFEHVYRDPDTNETVLRFHKTNIVRIKDNGHFKLSTGGWYTATTVAALNDALQALGMKITYQAPVSAGMWQLIDDTGKQIPFQDGMVIPPTKPEHSRRGAILLKAYNGGVDVPRYARKPQAVPAQAQAAGGRPPAAQVAVAAGNPTPAAGRIVQQQLQQPAPAPAVQRPVGDIHEQLQAAMLELGLDEDEVIGGDEHLCVVCLENPRDEVLVPCGHMVLCHVCCAGIIAKSNECPVCRETIEDHCIID